MTGHEPLFETAEAYQDDVLSLPVHDVATASAYYSSMFGMTEISRSAEPVPRVVLERDGVKIGFAVTGGDSSQDGAAIRVTDVARARDELTAKGVEVAHWRIDERDGSRFQVFFVVAPDDLCYYFYQPI